MAVSSTDRKENFLGGQVRFDFNFPVLTDYPEYIKIVAVSSGTAVNLEYGVDYEVSLNENGAGGSCSALEFDDLGERVAGATFSNLYTYTVYRETENTQLSDYEDFNRFPADTLERDLDRRAMVAIEAADDITRSVSLPIETPAGVSSRLPTPSAGKAIRWNDDATGLENTATPIEDYVADAQAAQLAAEVAQGLAEGARDDAQTAQGLAEDARDAAQSAQSGAEAAEAGAESVLFNKLSSVILEAPNGVAVVDPNNSKKLLVKSGLRVLIPDGRNADGSFKNIDYTLPTDIVNAVAFSSARNGVYGIYNGGSTATGWDNTISQEATPNASTFQTYWWYKPSAHLFYNSNGSTWTARSIGLLGRFVTDSSGNVTSLTTFTDGYTDRIITSRTPHIVESWVSGLNGYIKYSNGLIEQWGEVTTGSGNISLNKAMTTTNYIVIVQQNGGGAVGTQSNGQNIGTKTTSNFQIVAPGTNLYDWYVKGY